MQPTDGKKLLALNSPFRDEREKILHLRRERIPEHGECGRPTLILCATPPQLAGRHLFAGFLLFLRSSPSELFPRLPPRSRNAPPQKKKRTGSNAVHCLNKHVQDTPDKLQSREIRRDSDNLNK